MNFRLTATLLILSVLILGCYFFTPSLFSEITYSLRYGVYKPHFNSSGIVHLYDKSIHCWVYVLILAVTILIAVVEKLFKSEHGRLGPSLFVLVSFVMFFLIVSIDLVGREKLFQGDRIYSQGKTTSQRYASVFGATHEFTEFCKMRIHGRWGGQLATDFSLSATLEPYVIIYQLYPTIDLAVNPQRSMDTLVVFNRENAKDFLSSRYPWRVFYDEHSFLAVNDRVIQYGQFNPEVGIK